MSLFGLKTKMFLISHYVQDQLTELTQTAGCCYGVGYYEKQNLKLNCSSLKDFNKAVRHTGKNRDNHHIVNIGHLSPVPIQSRSLLHMPYYSLIVLCMKHIINFVFFFSCKKQSSKIKIAPQVKASIIQA